MDEIDLFDYTALDMQMKFLLRWLPAFLVMTVIFGFSSIPSGGLPDFGPLDLFVKKGGHVLGYAFLALAYWYALRFDERRWWLALLLTLAYAASDEFHQSFVQGRHPSWVDALVFDGIGAAFSLGLYYGLIGKRTAPEKNE